MTWVPGVGHVPPGGFYPVSNYPAWQAAANAVANANAMAAATAQAQAAAAAVANANAVATATQVQTRAAYIQALQTHLASITPAVAANPDASAHLTAAQSIVPQLA